MSQAPEEQYWKSDYQKVIDILTPLEKTGKPTDDDVGLLVKSLYALKRYEEAEAIVKRHPDNRVLDYFHVCILKDTGRSEEAEIVRQKALDYVQEKLKHAKPGIDKAHCFNDVAVLQADRKRKIEYYEMSLKESPDDIVVNYNLALSLQKDGQIDQALKHARRSVELKPDYARALKLVQHLEDAQREPEIDSCPTTARSITSDHSLLDDQAIAELMISFTRMRTDDPLIQSDIDRLTKIVTYQVISDFLTQMEEREKGTTLWAKIKTWIDRNLCCTY